METSPCQELSWKESKKLLLLQTGKLRLDPSIWRVMVRISEDPRTLGSHRRVLSNLSAVVSTGARSEHETLVDVPLPWLSA